MAYTDLEVLFDRLFPICRSITGPGYEQSLQIIGQSVPLKITTLPVGTPVFDWEVPKTWSIREAYLVGPGNKRVVDFKDSNLHVVNYSASVNKKLTLEELRPHLHTLPNLPHAVPYVTSYYKKDWGFCLSYDRYRALPGGTYHAYIDSEFSQSGGVTYAQTILEGESPYEIVLSSYLCHPSLANNELSGPLALVRLFEAIRSWPKRRYTYRFVLNPETVGSLCFLKDHGEYLKGKMVSGMVLTCLGGAQKHLSYKLSRREDSILDQCVLTTPSIRIRPFTPTFGSDERQYCSPGFNLPMGQMARTLYGEYKEYHTSLDNKAYMRVDRLYDSAHQIEALLQRLEYSGLYQNMQPYGEPQLGKRELYPNQNTHQNRSFSSDSVKDSRVYLNRLLTVLNYCDGGHTMLSIADRCGCTVDDLKPIIERLEEEKLLKHAPCLS